VSDGTGESVLLELHVADLGVIERLTLRPGRSMTAVTGETGAGKTLVVGAIALLAGGRADATMVRAGATEAVVDGRFVVDGEELVLTRVIPASGRSRAYRDGRPITVSELAAIGGALVEIHGQHVHQQLLQASAQRAALDQFGGIDITELEQWNRQIRDLHAALDDAGGDERNRARELDLVRYQLAELDAADLDDPEEDDRLRASEETFANVESLREAGHLALAALEADQAARDRVAEALSSLRDRTAFSLQTNRLSGIIVEIDEVASEIRDITAALDDDPERLALIQQRRTLLGDLRRKYGPTLSEVIVERDALRERLAHLEGLEGRRAMLGDQLAEAQARRAAEAKRVCSARHEAAPRLAAAVQTHLATLGMARAVVDVQVGGDDAGSDVTFCLAANPGSPPLPLARVASGGELSRTMLALRLVLSGGPPVAIFDEVDAGIGGESAVCVADSLRRVADQRQVLVVTHLAQVAARAASHVVVAKDTGPERATTTCRTVDPEDRVTEIARMLSGSPDSDAARTHAAELLMSGAGSPVDGGRPIGSAR
jgi:DNA repair protein RecN (Recombination protein N)